MRDRVAEHMYVDERRIISYSNQIAGSVELKKVPIMSGDISLLGPKAAVGEVVIPVHLEIDDRIRIVADHLQKYRHMKEGRIATHRAAMEKEPPFRLETCVVTRITVPRVTAEDLVGEAPEPKELRRIGFRGCTRDASQIVDDAKADAAEARYRREYDNAARRLRDFADLQLWYSAPEPDGAELFLIADRGGADEVGYGFGSAFSILRALTHQIGEAGDLTKLRVVKQADEASRRFSGDPLSELTRLGARAGDNRRIRCLYRVREVVLYGVSNDAPETLATIGYPIWIDAA